MYYAISAHLHYIMLDQHYITGIGILYYIMSCYTIVYDIVTCMLYYAPP